MFMELGLCSFIAQKADSEGQQEQQWKNWTAGIRGDVDANLCSCLKSHLQRLCGSLHAKDFPVESYMLFRYHESCLGEMHAWSNQNPASHSAGAMEHNDKFHHWHQGKDAGVAIQVEDPKLFWCRAEGSGQGGSLDRLAMRQVWDGGEIVANIDSVNSVKQVRHSCPP